MEKKIDAPKKIGRPPSSEVAKKSIEITVEGDFVVVKIPRKELTKKLLAELI